MKKKGFLGLVLVLVFGILIISTFRLEAGKPEKPQTFIKFLKFGSIVVDTSTPYESPPIDCSNYTSLSLLAHVQNLELFGCTVVLRAKYGPVGDVDEVESWQSQIGIPPGQTGVIVEGPMPVLAEFLKIRATIINGGASAKLDFNVVLTK